MFKKPTVLIIGAGASAPFDFPTGQQLKDDVCNLGRAGLLSLTHNKIGPDEAKSLLKLLESSMDLSIDQAVEPYPHLHAVAKRVMAAVLLRCEHKFRKARAGQYPHHWIRFLFSKMHELARTPEDFCHQRVSFVTFNYDRILEWRFEKAFAAAYPNVRKRSWALLQPVVHVHGSLGALSTHGGILPTEVVPFGPSETPDPAPLENAIEKAETNIKIVHEAHPNTDEFRRARQLLSESKQVIFVGFGFGKDNVERLDLVHLPNDSKIWCSATRWRQEQIETHILSIFPGRGAFGPYCSKGEIIDLLQEKESSIFD